MTQGKIYNVLFLCAGNAARSIMAEALMARWGKGRFRAWSAGSRPAGQVHPRTLALLARYNLPTDGLRSKSWDEFAAQGAPQLDFVFTVCDRTAGETCPVWPGRPVTAHWSVEDPVAVTGNDAAVEKAFRKAFLELEARIKLFTALRIEALDNLTLRRELDAIGDSRETAA
jgi:protein-tyrosine-phosphatase